MMMMMVVVMMVMVIVAVVMMPVAAGMRGGGERSQGHGEAERQRGNQFLRHFTDLLTRARPIGRSIGTMPRPR